MKFCKYAGLFLFLFGMATQVHAWSGHDVTEHNLRVFIPEIADIKAPQEETEISVSLENKGDSFLRGKLSLKNFVDGWNAVGAKSVRFELFAGEKRDFSFKIASAPPFYAALYPVHAYADFRDRTGKHTVHAVRIFRTTTAFPKTAMQKGKKKDNEIPREPTPLVLEKDGALTLWDATSLQVGWRYYDKEIHWKPVGWLGSDPLCAASISPRSVNRGSLRNGFSVHPPWKPGGGSIWADFKVSLPASGPVKFYFANAIRDHSPQEPGSDGVLFRVWVLTGKQAPEKPVFEIFSDSKVWQDHAVDLGDWLGKTVTLRLETHPGPMRDTQCDGSYWGEPMLLAGRACQAKEKKKAEVPAALLARAKAIASGGTTADGQESFLLKQAAGGPYGVVVKPGDLGLLNAWFVFANAKTATAFHGLDLALLYETVGLPPARKSVHRVIVRKKANTVCYRHKVGKTTVDITLRAEGAGLRMAIESKERVTRFGPGAWMSVADQVFWGHGYVIDKPNAFRMGFGGHGLASSHVAFAFGDIAVLEASDTPPSHLQVDPKEHTYALFTRNNSVLTFVPAQNAFAAALAYRPLFDKQPAPGVENLAGRMCFDIWGGKYAYIHQRVRQAVRLGLTDSFLTVHNWQRWGYDYRLPDVWPPNTRWGSIEDMRKLGEFCREQKIPWGLHDNYIDFYPDAEEYSYKNIYFSRNGDPHKAWHNKGREAYSYKFQPNRILPFVKRNLKAIKRDVAPTHCFLDVFTSTNCAEWWDWDGNFHSAVETRRLWGETFAWIRDYLGNNAPTTSEAGHDQLIGYLDGADCQWMTLAEKGRKHVIGLSCGDWERTPWYDTVNHRNFILHGVGYSTRYQGGRPRHLHGINSDDYLSMEVLSGHAAMVDSASWGYAATRKYYLLQDLLRRLALRNIVSVEFVDGDIHRQRVLWDEGTEVFVNRGKSEWTVAGHTLPQYGFLARNGGKITVLEIKNEDFAESSVGETGWFCNARTALPGRSRKLYAKPSVKNFRHLGDGQVSYLLDWDILQKSQLKGGRVFIHFLKKGDSKEKILLQDDHSPALPVESWLPESQVCNARSLTIPSDFNGDYLMVGGMYSSHYGRAQMLGPDAGSGRILLGTIRVVQRDKKIADLRFLPTTDDSPNEIPTTNPVGTLVDFGFAKTDGAFRVQEMEGGLCVTPLPDGDPCRIILNLPEFAEGNEKTVKRVTAIPLDETKLSEDIPFQQKGDELFFLHQTSFAYKIRWE